MESLIIIIIVIIVINLINSLAGGNKQKQQPQKPYEYPRHVPQPRDEEPSYYKDREEELFPEKDELSQVEDKRDTWEERMKEETWSTAEIIRNRKRELEESFRIPQEWGYERKEERSKEGKGDDEKDETPEPVFEARKSRPEIEEASPVWWDSERREKTSIPFASRDELVRGMIWSEILGPPRSLRPHGWRR